MQKGNIYQDVKIYDKAIESFKKAIELQPSHYDAMFNLAITYQEVASRASKDDRIQGLAAALDCYNKIPQQAPGYSEVCTT